jgi:hypothetical protein
MKNITKYIIVFIIFMCFGCEDYLEREPKSSYLAGEFYNTEAAIKQGTNGVYQKVYMDFNGTIPCIVLFDMYTGLGIERNVDNSVGAGAAMATSFLWEQFWAHLYESVARCNTVLDGAAPFMDELEKSDKIMQYLAEIKTLRAYFYYYLMYTYGEIPFFTHAVTSEDWKTATRRPLGEILPILFDDLENAAKYLPWRYTAPEDWGRTDRSFALGLKARIALNAGGLNVGGEGQKYFEIARDAAKQVMDESGRDLSPDYAALFTKAGQATEFSKNENIFEIMYGGAMDDKNKKYHYISWGEYSRNVGQSGRFPTQLLVDTYEMKNGKRIDEAGSGYNPKNPFLDRDARLYHTIYTHGDTCVARLNEAEDSKIKFVVDIYFDKTTFILPNGTKEQRPNIDRNSNLSQYGLAESGVGYLWKKYNHYDDEPASSPTYNYVVMRFAEILLIYAEAKIELNEFDESVYSAIDRVRSRSGQPALRTVDASRAGNQEKMRQIVRRERKVELIDEGLHFFDMRRWRIGDLENSQPTFGYPVLANADRLSLNVDSYALATPDMVPSFGTAGSREDINDIANYSAFADKLRVRDKGRYWNDAFYLSPLSQAEMNKAPQLRPNNPGYGN